MKLVTWNSCGMPIGHTINAGLLENRMLTPVIVGFSCFHYRITIGCTTVEP